jgi:hypothetical protein
MFRTIISLAVALSFILPIAGTNSKEILPPVLVTIAAPCPTIATIDPVKIEKIKTQNEQHKKKFHAPRHHHKPIPHHHHKSIPHHHHHVPQKISAAHGPLHLTSPPGCW